MNNEMEINDEELRRTLTPEEYHVLRERGTEMPFSGKYVHETRDGTYTCKVCQNPLFASTAKFDSKTGWPSFDDALQGAVEYVPDTSRGFEVMEVCCARCHSHLGHVFDDGPTGTGKRYCTNSVCLELRGAEKSEKKEHPADTSLGPGE